MLYMQKTYTECFKRNARKKIPYAVFLGTLENGLIKFVIMPRRTEKIIYRDFLHEIKRLTTHHLKARPRLLGHLVYILMHTFVNDVKGQSRTYIIAGQPDNHNTDAQRALK